MANGKATAQISARIAEIRAARNAVFKESVQRVCEIMQTPGPSVANPTGGRGGNMPIASGFLRASLQAVLGTALPASREKPDGGRVYTYDPGEVSLTIARADFEDTITVAYAANYAKFVNYRYQFVGLAVQRWPGVVAEVEREVKARMKL